VDILAAIDAAVGCQQCGGKLGNSPSDDFCDDECQQEWHAERSVELVGYREPWRQPWLFPGVGTDAYRSRQRPEVYAPARWSITSSADALAAGEQIARGLEEGIQRAQRPTVEFRLPRETGDLAGDWIRARAASRAAGTPEQHAAVKLRIESLTVRQEAVNREFFRRLSFAFESIGNTVTEIGRIFSGAASGLVKAFQEAGALATVPPADPRARALAARRARNTGPAQRIRAPRSIGRPSSTRR
jgi:hypothetical protein